MTVHESSQVALEKVMEELGRCPVGEEMTRLVKARNDLRMNCGNLVSECGGGKGLEGG